MSGVLQLIPALWRDRLYGAYVVVGIILGAIQVGAAAVPDATQPSWLLPALAVYAYIGTALGVVAKSNVTSASGPPPAPDNPPAPDAGVTSLVGALLALVVAVGVALLVLALLR